MLNSISSQSVEVLTPKYIDVTCNILDYVCAETKDSKLLIGKQDINSIINIEQLFFKLLDSILQLKDKADTEQVSEFIVSHFKVLSKILMVEPRLKVEIGNRGEEQYVLRIFREFVFNSSKSEDDDEAGTRNLNVQQIRNACYQFIVELCKNNIDNCSQLVEQGLSQLCHNLPLVTSWQYSPTKELKSSQGYLGIYNLRNICYINSMLQQLYMTPAFRYGILLADE